MRQIDSEWGVTRLGQPQPNPGVYAMISFLTSFSEVRILRLDQPFWGALSRKLHNQKAPWG
ncbi:MAG: hypothetical protein ACR2NF_03690, partial [Pirellulales bacterium]